MKKRNARSVFFAILICLSAASYTYVNVGSKQSASVTPADSSLQTDEVDPEIKETKNINLPDLQMLRKAVEAGKRFLPAS